VWQVLLRVAATVADAGALVGLCVVDEWPSSVCEDAN
jgi:hypothetical protein